MNLRALWKEDNLLWEALLISLLAHFLLFHASAFSFRIHEKHVVEIDITHMGHLGTPGGVRRIAAAAPPKPAARPKEWLKPTADQKAVPAELPTKPVEAPAPEEAPQEYDAGTGTTDGLSRLPQLLNLSDLGAILKRFYPQEALTQRREAAVVMDIHIDEEGHVRSVDIVRSGGADFDDAARRAVKLLRFTPAFLGSRRVAVKMRQAIQFKLEE